RRPVAGHRENPSAIRALRIRELRYPSIAGSINRNGEDRRRKIRRRVSDVASVRVDLYGASRCRQDASRGRYHQTVDQTEIRSMPLSHVSRIVERDPEFLQPRLAIV